MPKYAKKICTICKKYAQDAIYFSIYMQNICKICKIYAKVCKLCKDTCRKYAENMHKICKKYAKNMQYICNLNCKIHAKIYAHYAKKYAENMQKYMQYICRICKNICTICKIFVLQNTQCCDLGRLRQGSADLKS